MRRCRGIFLVDVYQASVSGLTVCWLNIPAHPEECKSNANLHSDQKGCESLEMENVFSEWF